MKTPVSFPKCSFSLVFAAAILIWSSCTGGAEENDAEIRTFATADSLIQSALDDSLFAGAVFLAGTSQEILYEKAYGYATLFDHERKRLENPEVMRTEHLFDLASLTKIFATTFGLMVLHSDGQIDIDAPVYRYLPGFDVPDKREITIRHLLTHSSGLMQWYPTYYVAESSAERLEFTIIEPLKWPVGEQRRYSDLGFMVLGDVIEAVAGKPLDEFVQERIFRPAGLSSARFKPDTSTVSRIVSTSYGNPFEKKMVADPDFGYRIGIDAEAWNGWRDDVLRGEVNDGNAFHTQQGVAGHAGLFSTASDLYTLLTTMLNDGEIGGRSLFGPKTIELFTEKDAFGNGLGWMMDAGSLNIEDEEYAEGIFGHTGFTGTNILISPEDDLILILLTNRQHMGVNENGTYPGLRELREKLAALMFD